MTDEQLAEIEARANAAINLDPYAPLAEHVDALIAALRAEQARVDALQHSVAVLRDMHAADAKERERQGARVAELDASVAGIYEYAEVYVRAMGPRMPADGAEECAAAMNRAARAVGRAEQFAITHGMLTYTEGKHDENTTTAQPPPGA